MTDRADPDELARLDEVIAEHDARDGPDDRWRAAGAVDDKARLVQRLEGDDAALPLYVEVVERLRDCREPGPRGSLMTAMNNIAIIHNRQGREGESRSAARALVEGHFDDVPCDAASIIALVNSALILIRLLGDDGEYDEALDLADRLIERYGQPGVPDYRYTAAAADGVAGEVLRQSGRQEEALERFDRVVRELADPAEPALRKGACVVLARQSPCLE